MSSQTSASVVVQDPDYAGHADRADSTDSTDRTDCTDRTDVRIGRGPTAQSAPRSAPKPASPAPLPIERGRPRVQRLVDTLTPLHIELAPPHRDPWRLTVTGLVEYEIDMSIGDLMQFGVSTENVDFHCVWGWSRPATPWTGVPTGPLLEAANPDASATHALFESADGSYVSCVTLDQARDGLLAVELDGSPLTPEHGGPLRWLQPHYLWGYKGVKWLTTITLVDGLRPGAWELRVGDVEGFVPKGIVHRFAELRAAGDER